MLYIRMCVTADSGIAGIYCDVIEIVQPAEQIHLCKLRNPCDHHKFYAPIQVLDDTIESLQFITVDPGPFPVSNVIKNWFVVFVNKNDCLLTVLLIYGFNKFPETGIRILLYVFTRDIETANIAFQIIPDGMVKTLLSAEIPTSKADAYNRKFPLPVPFIFNIKPLKEFAVCGKQLIQCAYHDTLAKTARAA